MDKKEIEHMLTEHAKWCENVTKGARADLCNPDLRGAKLSLANLSRANLDYADFEGADLSRADLSRADLRGANLKGANLTEANLEGADLRGANLEGANLGEAVLGRADFRGANLKGANLDFTAWPLWCGSLDVTIDERLARQLMYHALIVSSEWVKPTKEQADWANKFHQVTISQLPKIKGV